jgi:hypothetical protein
MIEVTFMEIILFAWAIIATGYAVLFKRSSFVAMKMVQQIIEDPTLYAQLKDGWEGVQKQFVKN